MALAFVFSSHTRVTYLYTTMGSIFTKDKKILMVGVHASGKTTILYRLKLGKTIVPIPTIGFNVETVEYKGVNFTMWDVGGADKIYPLWRHYVNDCKGVIFVVDSNDRESIPEARHNLHVLVNSKEFGNNVLLVLANKQDLPQSLTVAEVTERLELQSLTCKWHVEAACGTSGDGLYEGLDWLIDNIA